MTLGPAPTGRASGSAGCPKGWMTLEAMSAMAAWARWRGASDPLRFFVVIVLWLLLGVFVLYPLIELIRRALSDDAGFTLAPLIAAIHSKSNLRAFGNSLLLATLVGICGTVLGFLFAFTVERTTAPKFWRGR